MKTFLFSLAITAMVAMMTACNNAPADNDTKAATTTAPSELKIAYVEVDSIMTQYTFAIESTKELKEKAENIQATLTRSQQQLEAGANKLQDDYQNNRITSQDELTRRQNALQQQSDNLQALNQRLSNEYAAETEKFNDALSDSIQHFLAIYNKDKNYSLILSKVGDNILYASRAYDITDEIIAGLNKAYKPAKKDKDDKKK